MTLQLTRKYTLIQCIAVHIETLHPVSNKFSLLYFNKSIIYYRTQLPWVRFWGPKIVVTSILSLSPSSHFVICHYHHPVILSLSSSGHFVICHFVMLSLSSSSHSVIIIIQSFCHNHHPVILPLSSSSHFAICQYHHPVILSFCHSVIHIIIFNIDTD